MKRGLSRVLRVRALLEELSRAEMEKRAKERNRLLTAAEKQKESRQAARGEATRRLAAGDPGWLIEMADADLLGWRRGRLLQAAEERRPAVEAAREEMLSRRLERRQVETLVAEVAASEEEEQRRREQKQVDDWFQGRRMRTRPSREAE